MHSLISRRAVAAAGAAALALGLAACGAGTTSTPKASDAHAGAPAGPGRPGGTLTMLSDGDVDSIDPGISYENFAFAIETTTQRPLFAFKPGDDTHPVPDLAAGPAQVSRDGRTVTVHIRPGVRFSPPVDREVTADDVRYGIERGFLPSVGNGYTQYFDLVGVKAFQQGRTRDIAGLQTPDRHTLVMHLASPTGATTTGALVMPLTAPVPREYAAKFDARPVSTYGMHQVATGPYMIAADREGKLTGYKAGESIELVRNPSWSRRTDFRPAYLDRIDIREGAEDNVAVRQILDGHAIVSSGQLGVPPALLEKALRTHGSQVAITPSNGQFYITMNTALGPFRDVNVRRAVAAGFDRRAMLLAKGGSALGQIPTHFLPPGTAGFAQSGGDRGFGFDFMAHPDGDMALAAKYLRRAGYPSGRYTGHEKIVMVGVAGGSSARQAEVAQQQFEKLGFKVDLRLFSGETMMTKFCGVPSAKVAVCPNVGWSRDFADAATVLEPTFDGTAILPQGNVNWPQLNVPSVNAAMARANRVVDPAARARAWAQVNRLVTSQAPAIAWSWDERPSVESSDVRGVIALAYGTWDLAFTSLRQGPTA